MRLLLLARQRTGYTVARMAQAARDQGHALQVLPAGSLAPALDGDGARVLRRGVPLPAVDAVHWRPDSDVLDHGLMVLACLEQAGAATLNRAESLRRLRPRGLALAWLARAGVPVLPAVALRRSQALEHAVAQVGGLPVVLRAEDRHGRACSVAQGNVAAARAAADVLLSSGQLVLVQAGVRESTRVLVVGGRACAAVRRDALGNLSAAAGRAATAARRLAERTAAALELDVLGADVAWHQGAPAVEGVTPSPALEALEALCRKDLAPLLVRAWVRAARAAPRPVDARRVDPAASAAMNAG